MTFADTPRGSDDEEDARTTAQGLFNFGDAYLASARQLLTANLHVPFHDRPIRFMAYHAAELYLKAYLRAAGLTREELLKLGHSFRRLIPAAKKHGLELFPECSRAFKFGEWTGDVIESRYIRVGKGRWVETKDLGHCAAQVRKAVRLHPNRVGHIAVFGQNAGLANQWEREWGVL
jgi:HEPN domain-containing protein